MSGDEKLRERIAGDMPRTIAELERLVRIPSMGYPDYDPADVRASAETTRDILAEAGVPDARLLELDGGHPAVFGHLPGPSGAPTVLLYAHHDVQPEGPLDEWDTPPFEPVVKDGRMYGRGAADDKSGIVIHAAAIRALLADGDPAVTIKVVVEGEEECSTAHLPQLVQGNADLLRADVAVIADGGNYRTGVPTLNSSIRGVTDLVVQVRVLPRAQHSGSYGGADPRRDHGALADDRVTAPRRRNRRDRGAPTVPVDRDADPGRRAQGGVRRPRPGGADRDRDRSPTACSPVRPSRSSASTRRPSPGRRTRSSRSRAPG